MANTTIEVEFVDGPADGKKMALPAGTLTHIFHDPPPITSVDGPVETQMHKCQLRCVDGTPVRTDDGLFVMEYVGIKH